MSFYLFYCSWYYFSGSIYPPYAELLINKNVSPSSRRPAALLPVCSFGPIGSRQLAIGPAASVQRGGRASEDAGGENPERHSGRARRRCQHRGTPDIWVRWTPIGCASSSCVITSSCSPQGLTLDPSAQTTNLQMMVTSLGIPAAPVLKPLSEHFTLVSLQSRGVVGGLRGVFRSFCCYFRWFLAQLGVSFSPWGSCGFLGSWRCLEGYLGPGGGLRVFVDRCVSPLAGRLCESHVSGQPAVPGAAGSFVRQTERTERPASQPQRPADTHPQGNTHTWRDITTLTPPVQLTASLWLAAPSHPCWQLTVCFCVLDAGGGSARQRCSRSKPQSGPGLSSPW